jgi:hypothetical protein
MGKLPRKHVTYRLRAKKIENPNPKCEQGEAMSKNTFGGWLKVCSWIG